MRKVLQTQIPVAFTDERKEFKSSRLPNIIGDHVTDILESFYMVLNDIETAHLRETQSAIC